MYGLATWGMNWFLWVESRTQMAKLQPKSRPTWADVKRNLAGFDRAALLSLVQDLYAAHKDDQAVSSFPVWFVRGRSGAVQENHGSVALAERLAKAGDLCGQSQAGGLRLQEGAR